MVGSLGGQAWVGRGGDLLIVMLRGENCSFPDGWDTLKPWIVKINTVLLQDRKLRPGEGQGLVQGHIAY